MWSAGLQRIVARNRYHVHGRSLVALPDVAAFLAHHHVSEADRHADQTVAGHAARQFHPLGTLLPAANVGHFREFPSLNDLFSSASLSQCLDPSCRRVNAARRWPPVGASPLSAALGSRWFRLGFVLTSAINRIKMSYVQSMGSFGQFSYSIGILQTRRLEKLDIYTLMFYDCH